MVRDIPARLRSVICERICELTVIIVMTMIHILARLRSVISELDRVSSLLEGEASDAIGFFDESRKR